MAAAGYTLVEVLGYAPPAALVRHATGDMAQGLRNIARLETLSDLENVEPQMLQRSQRRGLGG